MLTKAQYKFLKEVVKNSKKFKKTDKISKFYDRERTNLAEFEKLLIKHKNLLPSCPFKNGNDDDKLEGARLIAYINIYLDDAGIGNFIGFNNDYFSVTPNGIEMMEQYKIEFLSKIRIPIIAILVSITAVIISIIALCTK